MVQDSKIYIYADTNVYGRPFDDLSILKNAWEAESARILFEIVAHNLKVILIGSDILKLEAQRTINEQKKFWIISIISSCTEWISQSEDIKKLAEEIIFSIAIYPRDAIHLASAIIGKTEYFLTFDSHFLKKSDLIKDKYKIQVINPVDFIKIL